MLTHAAGGVSTSHPPQEVVASGLILRRTTPAGDRWLLLKSRKQREWGFPKGHQEHGESLLATALRECAEECGIALLAVEGHPLETHYLLPSGRPKRVVFFPAITATAEVHLSDEHSEYAWLAARAVGDALRYANLRALFSAYRNSLRQG